MQKLRILLAVVGTVFLAAIIWAVVTGDFAAASAFLTSDPWGIVTLADLYFGFLLSAVVIALFERNWRAALWIAPIPFLGNVWTVAWFVVRLPALYQRLGVQVRD